MEKQQGITTHHPQHEKYSEQWEQVTDFADSQAAVKRKGAKYLKPTSGMKNGNGTNDIYTAYIARARVPALTSQALTSIMGLMFEKDPEGVTDEIITNDGLTCLQLAREVSREVSLKGRSILVVEAPAGNVAGAKPYIVRYPAESLINHKELPNNSSKLALAVFKEEMPDPDACPYSHSTLSVYRRYTLTESGVEVALFNEDEELIEDPVLIGRSDIEIIVIGSIDTKPNYDPVPLLPVSDCALSIYNLSADMRTDMHVAGQRTPWFAGMTEEQYMVNVKAGLGAGSALYLGMDGNAGGSCGYLESNGNTYAEHSAEIQVETEAAANHAVKIVQSGSGVESAEAIAIRSAAQHASIYTMADAISIGITEAMRIRADWGSTAEPEVFSIKTEFSAVEAGAQMITALNNSVNAGNLPRSVMFEAARRDRLTVKSDEELSSELETGMVE